MTQTTDNPKWFVPDHFSSTIHKVRYWPDTQTLDISFKSNAVHFYRYTNVPAELHSTLVASEAPGTFYSKTIRTGFDYKRVSFKDQAVKP